MTRLPLLASLLLLALAAPAAAMVRLPPNPAPIAGNPADRLLSVPIEDSVHDGARRCTPKAARPGMRALRRWLEANRPGPARSKAQTRAVGVSATYSRRPSGDRPMPLGCSSGKIARSMREPSASA